MLSPAVLLLCWTMPADAQTCTFTMQDIKFATVNTVAGVPVDVNGTITSQCSGFATPYVHVCFNLGKDDPLSNRVMTGPSSQQLAYGVYKDAARTVPWGSRYHNPGWQIEIDIALSSGAGTAVTPYYARVPSGQTGVGPGSYLATWSGNAASAVDWGGYTGTAPACGSLPNYSTALPFQVTATVTSDCSVSASNIDFGSLGLAALQGGANSTGVLSVTCTKTVPYTMALSAGTGAGATMANRRMTRNGGSETLAYALFTDAARTKVWGDGAGGSLTVPGTGSGTLQTLTVYAGLFPQASPPVGSYADTIVVTVTF